jgi:predicted esterase
MKGPHQGAPVAQAGAPLTRAKAAMILIHGRGATAPSILSLADVYAQPDIAYFAPQAAGNTWYPYSFLSPIEQNEPGLSSALQMISDLFAWLETEGFPAERVAIGGFSQGACLATEFVARNARRYGGVIGLSGGLIGPPGTPRDYEGSLDGTPVFLGCSDVDAHIPLERVQETTAVLSNLGGKVTERIYRGMGHTVNDDEIAHARGILSSLLHGEEAA